MSDSSTVQDQLRNVEQIQATASAFAAILADRSVVTWGAADGGGDSSAVRDSEMCSVFRPQRVHMLQYSKMDQSLHGATDTGAAEADLTVKTSISSNRFRLHVAHLLPPSQTAQLRHGAIKTGVVTALQCRISLPMCSIGSLNSASLATCAD